MNFQTAFESKVEIVTPYEPCEISSDTLVVWGHGLCFVFFFPSFFVYNF